MPAPTPTPISERPVFSFQSIAQPVPPTGPSAASTFTKFTPATIRPALTEHTMMQVSKVLSKEDWEAQLLAYVENDMLSLIFPEVEDRMKLMGISSKDVDRKAARSEERRVG